MSEPQEKPVSASHNLDWALQALVGIVNTTSIEISITLNVGGTIITGLLIGGASYFEGMAQAMGDANAPPAIKESLQSLFTGFQSNYKKPDNTPEEDVSEKMPVPPAFIHLKNATMLLGNGQQIPTNGGVYWRGPLSAVDGFFLGNLPQ